MAYLESSCGASWPTVDEAKINGGVKLSHRVGRVPERFSRVVSGDGHRATCHPKRGMTRRHRQVRATRAERRGRAGYGRYVLGDHDGWGIARPNRAPTIGPQNDPGFA